MLMVLAIVPFGCKEADEEEGIQTETPDAGCLDAVDLSNNSICVIIGGEKTNVTHVEHSTHVDPYVGYKYHTAGDQYEFAFLRTYDSGTSDYGNFLFVNTKKTPDTGQMTLDNTDEINYLVFSPFGSTDLYGAFKDFTGTYAEITISRAAPSVGERLQGTIGESKIM